MSRAFMRGAVRNLAMAATGALVSAALAGPAAADNERFQAAAGARLSDGTALRQEVPTQAAPATAGVHGEFFEAGGLASVPVSGGEASASALVPAMRTDGLVYATDAAASSGMTYSFHLEGVNTGERIPVSILGGASVNWVANAGGEADIYLAGGSGDTSFFHSWSAISTGEMSGAVIHKVSEILYLVPGVSYDVQLYAKAFASTYYAGVGELSSYALAGADPVFTVVGGYADRYAIVGVPQPEGSPGGVPEPEVWALMVLGFGGIGAMLRARHHRLIQMDDDDRMACV